jgi:SAM-dependent methyltransferase
MAGTMHDMQDSPPVEPTGERFIPTPNEAEVEFEHLHRYLLAAKLCAGKTTLDAASGEGYGAAILAAGGGLVTGVELDRPTVEAARRRYPAVTFVQADAAALPFEDGRFEVVTSFETLEHVSEPTQMLDEFRRVLKPGGLLIVSTPDKTIYNRHLAEPNPFHIHELEREEFHQALTARFRNVALYGQRVVFGSLLSSAQGAALTTVRRTHAGAIHEEGAYEGAMYLVAVCSDGAAPPLPEGVYEGSVPQNALSSLLGGIDERDQQIRDLRAQTDAARDALAEAQTSAATALHALKVELDQALTVTAAERQAAQLEREGSCARIRQLMELVNQADDQIQAAEHRRQDAQDRYEAASTQLRRHFEEFSRLHGDVPGLGAQLKAMVQDALFSLRRLKRGPRAAARTYISLSAIRRSGQFSSSFYTAGRADLACVDAVRHYFSFGASEGRDPSAFFSAVGYLRR